MPSPVSSPGRNPIPPSITGSFVVAAIPAVLIFAVSYPFAFAISVLVVVAVVVVPWALWRRATTDGLDVPGSTGTIRVERSEGRRGRDRVRWSLTVTVVDRDHTGRPGERPERRDGHSSVE